MHNESEQATTWSQVYSETTIKQSIPVITTWQLNERMYVAMPLLLFIVCSMSFRRIRCHSLFYFYRYGELQGLNKKETAERYGKEQVHEWRRSYDIQPPKGESLEMCLRRAVAYFKEFVRISFFFFLNAELLYLICCVD